MIFFLLSFFFFKKRNIDVNQPSADKYKLTISVIEKRKQNNDSLDAELSYHPNVFPFAIMKLYPFQWRQRSEKRTL